MEDVKEAIIQEVLAALEGGPPAAVATVIQAPPQVSALLGAKMLVRADGSTLGSLGGGALEEAVVERYCFHCNRPATRELRDRQVTTNHCASSVGTP